MNRKPPNSSLKVPFCLLCCACALPHGLCKMISCVPKVKGGTSPLTQDGCNHAFWKRGAGEFGALQGRTAPSLTFSLWCHLVMKIPHPPARGPDDRGRHGPYTNLYPREYPGTPEGPDTSIPTCSSPGSLPPSPTCSAVSGTLQAPSHTQLPDLDCLPPIPA